MNQKQSKQRLTFDPRIIRILIQKKKTQRGSKVQFYIDLFTLGHLACQAPFDFPGETVSCVKLGLS